MTIDESIGLIEADDPSPPGAGAVAAFEAQNGLVLPDDYRAFLAATPGGRVRHKVCSSLAAEEDGPEIMGTVYGLRSEGYASPAQRLADAEDDAIPLGLLPMMVHRGGNVIAMVLRTDRFGDMVFLDREVGGEGCATLEAAEADDWSYAFPFAPSFTAMVAGFKYRAG